MTNAKNILHNLTKPGRTLVFCDESDVHGQPNPAFVEDIRVLCAVEIDSTHYRKIDIREQIVGLKKNEFHTTEVVNPNSKSEWYGVGLEERVEILNHVRDLLTKYVTKVYYCYVSKSQYNDLRKEAEKTGKVNANHKGGVKKSFLKNSI
jgi:hypothetical protein